MRVLGAPARQRSVYLQRLLPNVMVATLLVTPTPTIAGEKWAPIPPDDKAVTQPSLDPESGAEVLLWTIHVEDEINGPTIHTLVRHEVRTKVFDARGAEEAGRVEIAHPRDIHIENIAARTVRPDGSVVELSKEQIFDRTLVKSSGGKVNVKSFAFPAVTPGCILEYRWTEIRYEGDAGYVYLDLQREHPVRLTELFVKPLPLAGTGYHFKMRTFNMPTPHFEEADDGFQRAILPGVPARREEPYMPPRRQVSPWAILYYTYGDDPVPAEIWKSHAGSVLKARERAMEADGTVKAMAHEIAAGGDSPTRKADRLYDWCRTHVDHLWDDRLGLSDTERQKQPRNRTPAETLRRLRGTAAEMVDLFIAMCRSVGIDARLAAVADRSEVFFDSRMGLPQLLDLYCAAVPSEIGWRFYDPSERWLGPGIIAWYMEGEEALLLDKEKPEFVKTPLAPPESTICLRTAHLRLAMDGGVKGSIRLEYTGHMGASMHEEYDELSPEARAERFRKRGPMGAGDAVFDSIRIEGVDDPAQRVVERAEMKVPGYAQPAGDRLLVPLSFFEWNAVPVFPAAKRHYPVYFAYPRSVADTVTIEIPEGYEVEALPDAEPLVARGVARYRSTVMVSTDGRKVVFVREFSFGEGDAIFFPADQYAGIKRLFDGFRQRDEATLSLRRTS